VRFLIPLLAFMLLLPSLALSQARMPDEYLKAPRVSRTPPPADPEAQTIPKDLPIQCESFSGAIALRSLYFKENSTDLRDESQASIQESAKIVRERACAKLFVKGFSAPCGKQLPPARARELAVGRTLTVKRLLIKYGVEPSRIVTTYSFAPDCDESNGLLRRVTLHPCECR